MTSIIRKFRGSKSGASAAEYALIIGLVGIAIIGGGTLLGTSINDRLSTTAALVTTP